MKKALFLVLALLLPVTAFAAGTSDETEKPEATETSIECEEGMVFDEETKECVKAESSLLNDHDRYLAIRELAYAGKIDHAQMVLAAMTNQDDPRALTYYGFTHRKQGNLALANSYYERAIAADPNNLLARSYMAQGLVEQGDLDGARLQLAEIHARGGAGTWPATSLEITIERGAGFSY